MLARATSSGSTVVSDLRQRAGNDAVNRGLEMTAAIAALPDRRSGMRAFDPKLVLLALYLALDWRTVADRGASLGPSLELGVFVALYGLLAMALAAAAYTPRHAGRIALAAVFAAASWFLQGYEWATGSPLDYNAFETMVASRGDAGSAFAQHGAVMVRAGATALVLFAALALPPRRKGLPYGLHWALPLAAIVALAAMLYVRGGEGSRALPAAFAPVSQAAIKGWLLLTEDARPRNPVRFAPVRPPAAQDIVLIVDESVAANYLDINSPRGVHSGLREGRAGLQVVNYGVAASVANVSAGSNRTLRFGGTRGNYRDVGKFEASIWAYAKAAGLRTVYLDGQRFGGALQNLMTAEERAEIDDFVQLGSTPVMERDQVLARLLAERLENGVAEFIYVNKVGAHFPVADKFPAAAARYHPLPARGETASVIDMGPVHGDHAGTAEEWRLYRNAYRNTLIWNTGGFFDTLLPRLDPSRAVILYTSDHGQDLHERGNPGKATHGTNDPMPEEGAVPLVVIDSAGAPRLDWAAHAAANHDGMSHFRVFPTLLALMGFAENDVARLYGPSLVSPARDALSFTNTYFATLGREPSWRTIDPAALAQPPADDTVRMAMR
jgi:lipid A ethanolaminephosphotransferase